MKYYVVLKTPEDAEKNPTAQILFESEAEKKGYAGGYYLDKPGHHTIEVQAFDDIYKATECAAEHIGPYNNRNADVDDDEYIRQQAEKMRRITWERENEYNENQPKNQTKTEKRVNMPIAAGITKKQKGKENKKQADVIKHEPAAEVLLGSCYHRIAGTYTSTFAS